MPEYLSTLTAAQPTANLHSQNENDALRLLSRSPHPYHRQKQELLEPSDKISASGAARVPLQASDGNQYPRNRTSFPAVSRENTPTSDSGTEADDEHFLKGLPAPRTKLHKGLRGRNEVLSGYSSPFPSPAPFEDEAKRTTYVSSPKKGSSLKEEQQQQLGTSRRNKVIIRRLIEVCLLGSLGFLAQRNDLVRPVLYKWRLELYSGLGIAGCLTVLYPFRIIAWNYKHRRHPHRRLSLSIPSSFDPAPLLYPFAITLLVSSLISSNNDAIVLPNIILAVCSLPAALFPAYSEGETFNQLQWLTSCIPLILRATNMTNDQPPTSKFEFQSYLLHAESLVLLYPLHQYLCLTLHSFTTTSLLTAELQLLSVALINLLLLSSSPQITILKAMLWVGGLDLLVSCTRVILWGISLARVPKWRFRRAEIPTKRHSIFSSIMSWRRVRHDLFHAPMDSSSCSSCEAMDDHESDGPVTPSQGIMRVKTTALGDSELAATNCTSPTSPVNLPDVHFNSPEKQQTLGHKRRHTLPFIDKTLKKSHTHTPSGRRKRSASTSVRAFFSLTQAQATTRKWIYAAYVYLSVIGAILVPSEVLGVKEYVQKHALHGHEPVGWAIGYLFGDLPTFRFQVLMNDLEGWICLPSYTAGGDFGEVGWVQSLRYLFFGEANTRLLLSLYYLGVICCGLLVVFRLSPFYEVDTRRKVFHFMMVAMFAPSIYIDPTFVALALSIVLALFLLLDLLRASQLPPLSKPLASFLAPYVDGRDLRGPVVISHIFLLIGCAIPLWLSLGSLPRTGTGYLEGWEVPTREVSMISGVICVGLGDAAASLIGRRYGHRKWLWGGGKSLEGSVAFAVAVFLGLMAAYTWLRVGGWQSTTPLDSVPAAMAKSGVCASMASLTEAVLTGGNDNVIVPVVLWTCVKSLGI